MHMNIHGEITGSCPVPHKCDAVPPSSVHARPTIQHWDCYGAPLWVENEKIVFLDYPFVRQLLLEHQQLVRFGTSISHDGAHQRNDVNHQTIGPRNMEFGHSEEHCRAGFDSSFNTCKFYLPLM